MTPRRLDALRTLRDFPRYLTAGGLANAGVAWLWNASPLLITLAVARQGNLPEAAVVSWLSAAHVVGGVLSITLGLYYRQPIVGAYTIPGVVLVGGALTHLPFEQIVGAYWFVGILIVLLGATGLVRRVIAQLPFPIMMGMVAGVLLPFALAVIRGLQQAPVLSSLPIVAFAMVTVVPGLRRIPPVLAALIAGLLGATWLGQADWAALSVELARPQFVTPSFSAAAAAELVIPLVLMVVAVQNVQGYAALRAAGYEPPLSGLTVAAGIGTLVSALAGSPPASIAGPSTAIVSAPSSGPSENRHTASMVLGVLWIVTGLLAPAAAALTRIVPRALVDVLAGLALLPALAQFFHQAFGGRFRFGALTAFLVTVSGLVLFRVSAPFWALVAGMGASMVLDRADARYPADHPG